MIFSKYLPYYSHVCGTCLILRVKKKTSLDFLAPQRACSKNPRGKGPEECSGRAGSKNQQEFHKEVKPGVPPLWRGIRGLSQQPYLLLGQTVTIQMGLLAGVNLAEETQYCLVATLRDSIPGFLLSSWHMRRHPLYAGRVCLCPPVSIPEISKATPNAPPFGKHFTGS